MNWTRSINQKDVLFPTAFSNTDYTYVGGVEYTSDTYGYNTISSKSAVAITYFRVTTNLIQYAFLIGK